MADYKELLRRAIAALPENNGAARRAVYEKARAALVGQLRAITPPLPARDITQHRLQLEDCIRQVEQEASEAVISLARNAESSRPPVPAFVSADQPQANSPPQTFEAPAAQQAQPEEDAATQASPSPEARRESDELPTPARSDVEAPAEHRPQSIEDIITAAAAAQDVKIVPSEESPAEQPRKDALKLVSAQPSAPSRFTFPFNRRGSADDRSARTGDAVATARVEAGAGGAAMARLQDPDVAPVEPALSSVREVDVDPDTAREAEGAIERAIETLDRAARGEDEADVQAIGETIPFPARPADEEPQSAAAASQESPRRGGGGLTIFLVVFLLLLAGAAGAGYWAVREGYLDLDQMFGRTTLVADAEPAGATEPVGPTLTPPIVETSPTGPTEQPTGPGNTTTETAPAEPTTAIEGIVGDDRLTPAEDLDDSPAGAQEDAGVNGDRLTVGTNETTLVDDPLTSVDPAVLAGSQSLLLEASEDGRSGATPFSGTVEWTRGTDEVDMPTLVAVADIPARNLGVTLTIRRNADPSLPASHLMEVDFNVPATFVGGGISGLPGILLKNQELIQGTPLVGASARVVGNSFLFALSASDADRQTNRDLLAERRWMDLAIIYSTGRRAIITLEKDDDAQALFRNVFAEWQAADAE